MDHGMLSGKMAVRTLQMPLALAKIMKEKGKSDDEIKAVIKAFFSSRKIKVDKNLSTEYLIFVGDQNIKDAAAQLMTPEIWSSLSQIADEDEKKEDDGGDGKAKPKKKKTKIEIPENVKKQVGDLLDKLFSVTPDIALFGRMVANAPKFNTIAACQVAHAISTNRMNMEYDYYTALDELKPEDEPGAGMIGLSGFNAPCMYRYLNIDVEQLVKNLGDKVLASEALASFLSAAIKAIPKGKDKTMPANNPPAFVMVVLRDDGFWSLTNAFEKPAKYISESKGLVEHSIEKMIEEWATTCSVMGKPENVSIFYAGMKASALPKDTASELGMVPCKSIDELVKSVISGVKGLK